MVKVIPNSSVLSKSKSKSNSVFFNLLNNLEFLKGLFVFCSVAILLFIFEIVLFYVFIVPMETNQMINFLTSSSSGFSGILNSGTASGPTGPTGSTPTVSNVFLDVLKQRENSMDSSINMYYIYIMIVIICILFITFLFSVYRLNLLKAHETVLFGPSIVNAVIIILLILAFQIQVFFFGQQFKYPSSVEMTAMFSKTISDNLPEPTMIQTLPAIM